jgi:hypothetical protein
MCGSATLATDVSSTYMKVPSITAIVISQGFAAGRHSASAGVCAGGGGASS